MRSGQRTVLVINGPNLNLLGIREPHIYGHETLQDVEDMGKQQAKELKAQIDFFQRCVRAILTIEGITTISVCPFSLT